MKTKFAFNKFSILIVLTLILFGVFPGAVQRTIAQEGLNPFVSASPDGHWVYAYDWPLGTEVTLTIGGYHATATMIDCPWRPGGTYYPFNLPAEVELAPGVEMTATGQGVTKTLVVSTFAVTGLDVASDTLTGTATPNANVHACADTPPGGCRYATADQNGFWIMPRVEGGFVVAPGTYGWAVEVDAENDETYDYWTVPNPRFEVRANIDQVRGWEWTVGETLTLNINGNEYTGIVGVTSYDPNQSYIEFNLSGSYDILPGDFVSITNGLITKDTTITKLELTEVNISLDIVGGKAAPGTNVDLWVCNTTDWVNFYRHVTADGDGNWTANFSTPGVLPDEQNTFDIVPGTWVDSQQMDPDNDTTMFGMTVPNAGFGARANWDLVEGWDWTPGEIITVQVDGEEFTATVGGEGGPSYVVVNLAGIIDIQAGDVISMTNGVITKEIVVTNLEFTDIDWVHDTVSGIATPSSRVDVWTACDANGCINRHVDVDGEGNWLADFAHPGDEPDEQVTVDITPGMWIDSREWDGDNDATMFGVTVPIPAISANPNAHWIYGQDWPVGADVTLKVGDYSATVKITGPDKMAWFDLNGMDLQPGDEVTLSGSNYTQAMTIANLTVTSFDVANNSISGTTSPNGSLYVCTNDDPQGCHLTSAGHDGLWTYSYDSSGFVLKPGVSGWASVLDPNGNQTVTNWQVPNPRFDVRANVDQIQAWEWPFGDELKLVINGDTFTTTVNSWDSGLTYAEFNLSGIVDILPGQTVTMSNGPITKETLVTTLAFTDIDQANDTVSGMAPANSSFDIWACNPDGNCPNRHVEVGDSGSWTIDFANPGGPDEQGTVDIIPGTWIDSRQADEDSDGTMFGMTVLNPILRAWPNRDIVDGEGWMIGEHVTLMVDGRIFKSTVRPAFWDPTNGVFTFQLSGMVDIKPGTIISVTNGKITKTTVVTGVEISGVDVEAETVEGIAPDDSSVNVWVSYSNIWNVRRTTADSEGYWSVDFSQPGNEPDEQEPIDIVYWTWVEADQDDEDGDLSLYGTPVPTPYGIYVVDLKTGNSRLLTQLPQSGEYNPNWSPNGKFIAHDVIGIGYLGIYLTDIKTGISVPLRGAEGGSNAAWSPNGKWIAFDRRWWDDSSLYYVPAAGGAKILVRENAIDATWAPSGSRLAFQDLADGNKIKTISISGSSETVVAIHGNTPAWSPSGEWIAFEWNGNIWKVRMSMAGKALSEPVQLTNGPGISGNPAWSADSKWIVFHSGTGDDFGLWKIPVAGGTAVKLVDTPGSGDYDPAYSYNGQYLAFSGLDTFAQMNNGEFSPVGVILAGSSTRSNRIPSR